MEFLNSLEEAVIIGAICIVLASGIFMFFCYKHHKEHIKNK